MTRLSTCLAIAIGAISTVSAASMPFTDLSSATDSTYVRNVGCQGSCLVSPVSSSDAVGSAIQSGIQTERDQAWRASRAEARCQEFPAQKKCQKNGSAKQPQRHSYDRSR